MHHISGPYCQSGSIARKWPSAACQAAKAGAQIVIWSETAAPVIAEDKPSLLRRAAALAPYANAPPLEHTPFGALSNIICFDADLPAFARVDADILIVPAWDWPEIAITHTMHMARLRAIENGYSLVPVDYNGTSAVFDPMGRIVARQDTTTGGGHMMMADVQDSGAATLYSRVRDLFAWLCVLTSGGLVAFARCRRRV